MTTHSPPLSPEQQYKGPVITATNKGFIAAAIMNSWVINSLNASLIAVLKLKSSKNYKIWAWEIDLIFALYPEYSNVLLKNSDNENIK